MGKGRELNSLSLLELNNVGMSLPKERMKTGKCKLFFFKSMPSQMCFKLVVSKQKKYIWFYSAVIKFVNFHPFFLYFII